jgi:NitT/TauT family transport system ATP-binding protein
MTAPAAMISLANVSKAFGKRGTAMDFVAVDRLSLDVEQGQMLALLGKTGCGKSTIFNMIAGLTEPTAGAVTVDGCNPFRDFDSLRGKIAIVFQNDRLLPWRTALQNVELGLEMRQRVSIARAFATDARILLCDEPFSALDEMTGRALRAEFVRLVKENGKTAVFITHSINEALEIGDRIVVLKRPANIAFDLPLSGGASDTEKEMIRGRIQGVLAA